MRRAGFAFFGIFNGTEFNPSFFEDIEKAVDKKKGAVLVCSIGGILEPLGQGGRQSRYAISKRCHMHGMQHCSKCALHCLRQSVRHVRQSASKGLTLVLMTQARGHYSSPISLPQQKRVHDIDKRHMAAVAELPFASADL